MAKQSSHSISTTNKPRWKHQEQTLSFLATCRRNLDTSDPGTGKTRGHIDNYARRFPRKRCLVVCPKTLMTSAWGTDIEKFAPHLTVSFAFAHNRLEAFKMQTDVVVINTDGVKWLVDSKANEALLKGFDHLIIDEFTAFKHPNAQRSKAMKKVAKYFEYRSLLSGTPTPNSVMELWHPMLICDDGRRLGTSYYSLRNSVQTPTQIGPSPQHVRWDDKPGATQAVNELLAGVTIRHQFEDVMQHVPPNHRHVKEFALAPAAKKAYDKMENDYVAMVDDVVVSAVHAASVRTKLLQIASGAVYDGIDKGSYKVIDRSRYELITELVEKREHSVVFFNWKHQRDLLSDAFVAQKISFAVIDGDVNARSRKAIIEQYQNGELQTLLLHPKTGAHGLTLTRGTTTIISSPIYEADILKQMIHRIYRGGQTQVTNTIFVQAKGTVEDLVYARLDDKTTRMQDLLDLMKARRSYP
ncbi:MAG: ATP-dependent RNA helicase RhlB [Firmicutes bacterium]|nr:ATP-dependent RNA helicase RhlB [candidate division NPL-UPA2 bacterium]